MDDLARALAQLTAILHEATGAERDHLLGLVSVVRAALDTVTGPLRARTTAGVPPAPDGLAAWLHDLRVLISGMIGWAVMLSPMRDAATTHTRAVEAIDRNAKLLTDLLGHPPG